MFTLILFVAALVGAGLIIAIRKQAGAARLNTLAAWLLACCIGFGGIWSFIGHAFLRDRVAASIGWAPSPFQWEIAVCNLAMGVLGLSSIVFRDRFRLAAAMACNIYLLGCAAGHIHQALAYGNFAINNVGPILWVGDIIAPLLTLIVVILADIQNRRGHADAK